jgi:hypothetical protein
MEKTQTTKIVATILILAALAAAGFVVSYFTSSDTSDIQGGVRTGESVTPLMNEEDASQVREELSKPPVATQQDEEKIREELSKPAASGELSEEEKARIRAELRR